MKRFIIYIISVLLPVLLILGVGEILVREVPNPYKYKEKWMETHQDEVELLVMGGSQTFYGVRPEYLDGKAFNLANVAQDLRHDYFLLKKFNCPRLKTIILPISYPTLFSDELENTNEWYRAIFYNIYMDYPAHSNFSKYNYEIFNMRTFWGKVYQYFKAPKDMGYDKWGWGATYKLNRKKMQKWRDGSEAKAAEKHHTCSNWEKALEYAEDNVTILKNIANDCNQGGKKLILISTPCWKSYTKLLNQRQLSKSYEIIYSLQKEYSFVYLDYLNDKRFEADDFYDSNHLSDIGAEKFSKILNEDIKTLR